jgi:hypothetical protein
MFAHTATVPYLTIDSVRAGSRPGRKWPRLLMLCFTLNLLMAFGQTVLAQQCSERFMTLSSQAEVDNFQLTYGPCDSAGGLRVSGSDITSLEGLAGLASIYEFLEVSDNPQLGNLSGLRNLRSVDGELRITYNASLINLDGLQGLEELDAVTIAGNSALTSLDGWPGSIQFMDEIWIEDNASLVDLGALSAVQQLDSLGIIMNPALARLDGLEGLQSINRHGLYIRENESLVSIEGLSALHTVRDIISIARNALLTNIEGLSGLADADEININGNPLLANLDGLRNLRTAKWFEISLNDALENLDGLSGVRELNILSVNENRSLLHLDGLSGLETIHYNLNLGGNDSLNNIDGLSNVTGRINSIGISSNPELRNIDALSGVIGLRYSIYIGQNGRLENVDGLAQLTGIDEGGVSFRDNPMLADCSAVRQLVDSIDDAEPGPGPGIPDSCVPGSSAGPPDVGTCVWLENNSPGCNSIDEVLFRIASGDEAGLRHAVAEANARGPDRQNLVSITDSGEPFFFTQAAEPEGEGAVPPLTGSLAFARAFVDDPPIVFERDEHAAAAFRLFEVVGDGSLALTDCEISGFAAPVGGAILYSGSGGLFLERCYFHGNQADFEGGAVALTGELRGEIRHSRFAGNGAATGCALAVSGDDAPGRPFRITESIFSGACAGRQLYQADNYLALAGNSFAGPVVATGGTTGLFRNAFDDVDGGAGMLSCESSGPGTLVSMGWNIAVDSSCRLVGEQDQPFVDPMLSPADAQGFMAPLAGSPAVDSAPAELLSGDDDDWPLLPCDWKDATGLGRPQDGNGDGRFECDAGAVELAGQGGITAGHSGAFYNSLRNGEGSYIEILENGGAVIYTFSYRPDGSGPAWLLGLADVVGNSLVTTDMVRPDGTRFGSGFDSDDIEFTDWGGMSVVFPDCAAGERPGNMAYSGNREQGYEPLITRAERISNIAGCEGGAEAPVENAGLSGSFFDPARNGEGLIVEWLTDGRVLAIFFTYGVNGGQMWLFGAGQPEGRSVTMDALYPTSHTAWGEAFDPDDVELSHWGKLSLDYSDCDHLTFSYQSAVEGYGSAVREYTRLSTLEGLDCPD